MKIFLKCVHFVLVLLFLLLASSALSIKENQTCTPCLCCKKYREERCQDKGLTYIPKKLPSWVTTLIFTGNNLNHVTKDTFSGLTTLRLEVLILRHNNIRHISPDAFSNLTHIRHLDLSGNGDIPLEKLTQCLLNLDKNISSIKLNSLGWTEEPVKVYQALSSYNITELSMSKNFLKTLNMSVISRTLLHLEMLDVSYNNIEFITPGKFENLTNLQLHHNYIDVDRPYLFMTDNECNFPRLKILNIAANFVNYFHGRFRCLDKLEYLNLDKNPVKQILKGTFKNLTSLKSLRLESIGDRLFYIEGHAFESNTLRMLTFARNHFPFTNNSADTFFDANFIFDGMDNLEELDLSDNYFNIDDGNLNKMLSKVTNLTKLTMKSCKFLTIPTGIFSNMQRLEMLNLSKNHIADWNGSEVFGNLTSLRILRLDHNYINVFNETSFPEKLMTNLKEVNMTLNPFYCGCKNLWFRKWIEERTSIFLGYPKNYVCHNPPDLAGTLLQDYFPSDAECNPVNTFLQILTTLSLMGIFTVIIVSLVYKGRWHIRYWIYLHRSKRSLTSVKSGDSFLYSGFVVYSDQDREWVINSFLDVVEKEEGLKLCIHHRDFVVGKLIVDNIAENIANSRKVILIMSNSMIQSDWCLFETRLAQRKFLNDEDGSLLIIMLENLQKKDMPLSLRNLVDMTTYISWSQDPYLQDRFWKTVIGALQD